MAEHRGMSTWPLPEDAPSEADLARCVHCGLCLNACPTYLVTGLETESPRGRIALARGVQDGVIPITAAVEGHWDRCLQCRACETACPSGVQYGRIMEHVRAQVAASPQSHGGGRRMRRWALRHVVASPRVLAIATAPLRLYLNTPLRRLVRRAGIPRLLGPLRTAEAQLVPGQGRAVRPGTALPQPAVSSEHAILFTGCIMGEVFGEVHRATARVLARRGMAVEAATGQGCCGALSAHDGDLAFARRLARRNIAAFEDDPRPIVVNAAGCGAALKEYGGLLEGDPEWSGRAAQFSARVFDFAELLDRLPAMQGARLEGTVAYQDACHLAHAQKIREQPRRALRAVEGCRLVETEGADTCCGAAGLYSTVQPEMSAALRSRKATQLAAANPDWVVTANPGCHMQYQAAAAEAGIGAKVAHLAEFLDRAEQGAVGG